MPNHPNILLITTDQHRKDALGCYGNAVIRTPNIDAIAGRGVRFPTVHRLRQNGMRLPQTERTLMEALRDVGYRTYGAGKMHFGAQWEFPADGSPIKDPDPATPSA